VNAAESLLDRLADPSKPGVRNVRYIRLDQPGRSAVVEHRFGTGYIGLMIKEAIEIKLPPSSFDRDCGFTLIRSWYLMTDVLKQYRCTNLEAST
jgi:hypothetical protein